MADQTIVIPKGATLGGLAKQYGTDVATLAKANNIANPNMIIAGANLKIPGVIPPAPTTPTPTTPPATVNDIYKSDPNASIISNAEKASTTGYDPNSPAPTQADTYAQALNQYQAQIDAINNIYATKRNEVTKQYTDIGNGRMGQEAALLANTGMAGSTFGSATTDRLTTANANELGAAQDKVDAEKANAIAAIYGQVRQQSMADYNSKIAAYTAGADKTIAFKKDSETRKSNSINQTAQNFLSANIDLSDPSKAYNGTTIAQYLQGIADDMNKAGIYGTVTPQDIVTSWKALKTAQDTATQKANMEKAKGEADIANTQMDTKQKEAALQKTRVETQNAYNDAGTKEQKAFYADILTAQTNLQAGKQDWGQAWNYIHDKYAGLGISNDAIDSLLNKDVWAKPGAYQEKVQSTKSTGGQGFTITPNTPAG